MASMRRSRLCLVAAPAGLALALAGCGSGGTTASTGTTSAASVASGASASETSAAYPRTVTLDGKSVQIKAPVTKAVAVSPDVAEVALILGAREQLAAVPSLNRQAVQVSHSEDAAKIAGSVDSASGKDTEKVLSFSPDLVMLTTRHEAEKDALAQLTGAGVAILSVTNDWDSKDVYARNVTAIGQALGRDDAATKHVADYWARYDAVTKKVGGASTKPVVGMIRILGPNVWITGPQTIGDTVLKDAGATSMAAKLGLDKSTKLDTEQIVKAAPDALVVVDSSGKGRAQYDEILKNPGIAGVPAIKNDKILAITSAELSSGSGGIVALEKMAAWLHPEAK